MERPRVVPGSTYGPGSYFLVKSEQKEPEVIISTHLGHKNQVNGPYMISKYENQNTVPIAIQISNEGSMKKVVSEAESQRHLRVVSEGETKRQLRLLKNKESQKICRTKKNHYVRCLEERVGKLSIIFFMS